MKVLKITIALFVASSLLTSCGKVTAKQTEKVVGKAETIGAKTEITTIKNQYALQAKLFKNVTEGISDVEADKRISQTTNSLKWIAGHTLDLQYNLAAIVGIKIENPYAAQFAFGKKFDAKAKYPSLEKMRKDWNALTPQISEALNKLTAEQLNAKPPFAIPFPEQSIKGLLGFQMHHLGYEIGQMGLYRKFLGKTAMSYQ